jgi:hypothetical protein
MVGVIGVIFTVMSDGNSISYITTIRSCDGSVPEFVPIVISIEFVPSPLTKLLPSGSNQSYESAPATASTEEGLSTSAAYSSVTKNLCGVYKSRAQIIF